MLKRSLCSKLTSLHVFDKTQQGANHCHLDDWAVSAEGKRAAVLPQTLPCTDYRSFVKMIDARAKVGRQSGCVNFDMDEYEGHHTASKKQEILCIPPSSTAWVSRCQLVCTVINRQRDWPKRLSILELSSSTGTQQWQLQLDKCAEVYVGVSHQRMELHAGALAEMARRSQRASALFVYQRQQRFIVDR